MKRKILIVGQGIAGTLLGWACERAGIDFELADAGHAQSASRVGAGMINPVTGRRWVKTWRVDSWLAPALAAYRELETVLGERWVRPMRVWRRFRDDAERTFVAEKVARGELLPFIEKVGTDGAWIEGAVQVDTAGLITAARAYWRRSGHLQETEIDLAHERRRGTPVILAAGAAIQANFSGVPWELAWGEIVEVEAAGLAPDVILNAGHWVLPWGPTRARVGATYERAGAPSVRSASPESRNELLASSAAWLGREPDLCDQVGGWRVTTADRRPCVGWHVDDPGLGVVGGLGSKGTLWAPALADEWVRHLQTGAAFDRELDVRRFAGPCTAGR